MEMTGTTPVVATLYTPVICLILQGAKELELGERRIRCAEGQSVVVSHELPIRSEIIEASEDVPYITLVLELDLALLRRVAVDLAPSNSVGKEACSLEVATTDPALIDAFDRLLTLNRTPEEIPAIAPLIMQEIHYRLLRAEHGAMLRQLLGHETQASRIAVAIARIRQDLTEPLAVTDLAHAASMSRSSFHEHFKAITATTPLQYQKDLRLLEARRLLSDGTRGVTQTAFAVGYRSPTQFSREYSRKFGASPRAQRGQAVRVA